MTIRDITPERLVVYIMAIKCCCLVAVIFGYVLAKNEKIMGPFDIRVWNVEDCQDIGTGDIRLSLKLNKVNSSLITADFNLTLKVSYDDDVTLNFSVDRLVNGVYSQNFIKQAFKKHCSTALRLASQLMNDILTALKVRHSCPIKKGFYIVKNFTTSATIATVPTFFYTRLRMTFAYHKHGRLIGCHYAYVDVIPKLKSY